jgi:hypothetical protein
MLAQGGLEAVLGSARLQAHQDGGGSLAGCVVKPAESASGRSLQVTLRWSTDAPPSGSLA